MIAAKYLATTDGFILPLLPFTLNLCTISQARQGKASLFI